MERKKNEKTFNFRKGVVQNEKRKRKKFLQNFEMELKKGDAIEKQNLTTKAREDDDKRCLPSGIRSCK